MSDCALELMAYLCMDRFVCDYRRSSQALKQILRVNCNSSESVMWPMAVPSPHEKYRGQKAKIIKTKHEQDIILLHVRC